MEKFYIESNSFIKRIQKIGDAYEKGFNVFNFNVYMYRSKRGGTEEL